MEEKKNHRNLYRRLLTKTTKSGYHIYTVTQGCFAGEKMLLTEGRSSESRQEGCLQRLWRDGRLSQETEWIEAEGQKIFCEHILPEKELVICGGGHVSMPVIRMGKMLEFRVTVLEDRPLFAENARRAGADKVICDSFEHALDTIEGGEQTCFVIVTRGHRYDRECLEKILKKSFGYVGMMGSKKRVQAVCDRLLSEGISPECLRQLHAPIGLPIHAQTPAEIAVSILSEIIACTGRKNESEEYSKEMLEILSGQKEQEIQKVLATIVERKGSAPRKAGTKMLILQDGRTAGTIGGGCMESEVVSKAVSMMQRAEETILCSRIDLMAETAQEEGMVCGGTITVCLEREE